MSRKISFLITLLVVVALFGCTEKPSAPEFNNPLDVANGVDPFNAQAGLGGNMVLISWNAIENDLVTGYDVLRAVEESGQYSIVSSGIVGTSAFDSTFAPNMSNWYKVRAVDASGATSALSLPVPTEIITPPMVVFSETSPSRYLPICISVAVGDTIEIADNIDFENSQLYPISPDSALTFDWDIGVANENGEFKQICAKAFTAGVAGVIFADSVEVSFQPSISLPNRLNMTTLEQTLQINNVSILKMRFADSREQLEAAKLTAAADTLDYQFNATVLDTQFVFGEFTNDFGFSFIDSLIAVPDSLNTPDFSIENNDEATSNTTLEIRSELYATDMRFAEDLQSFGDWEPYSELTEFELTNPTEDEPVEIWAQFKNDWVITNPISKTIIWIDPN